MSIMPDVVPVDAHLRLQFCGRDAIMLPSVVATRSDLAHDPNAPPVEALK
jgi:hypothetical protein